MTQLAMFSESAPTAIRFSRKWAMPNRDTFSIKPIAEFVARYRADAVTCVDPFARNSKIGTHRNDINPSSTAEYHLDAEQFLIEMKSQGLMFDLGLVDPPYSPRQVSECYKESGLKCTMTDTQNSVLYKRVRDAMRPLIRDGGIVLSFGWNSVGMGESRGFKIVEIMTVCHGGAHNDTICMAEVKS